MDRWLVRDKSPFDVIESVSDQSVKSSEAGKCRHGTRGGEGAEARGTLKWEAAYVYPRVPGQGNQERKFIRTETDS